jgi:hypothetical protein
MFDQEVRVRARAPSRSDLLLAAVDEQFGTVHEARIVRSEEQPVAWRQGSLNREPLQ